MFRRILAASVAVMTACGVGPDVTGEELASVEQEVIGPNGLTNNSLNGNGLTNNSLNGNGLSSNSLNGNGLTNNGLTNNSLNSNGFSNWFNLNTVKNDNFMKYLVLCALPAGQTRTYGAKTWQGRFGLAPVWVSGQAIPVDEQEKVSACLAAHVNAAGVSVQISLTGMGQAQDNTTILAGIGKTEAQYYTQAEGAFYGNVFAAAPYIEVCSYGASTGSSCGLASNKSIAYGEIAYFNAGAVAAGRSCAQQYNECGFAYNFNGSYTPPKPCYTDSTRGVRKVNGTFTQNYFKVHHPRPNQLSNDACTAYQIGYML